MVYIFIDTNIFIHFKDFEEIDWPNVANTREPVTLVIAHIVIDELDKHKRNASKRTANRVRSLLPRLEAIIENMEPSRHPLHYIPSRPRENTLIDNHLDRGEQDDLLLASIIEFREKLRASGDASVVLVTNDTGPRLKARTFSIKSFKMPDDYMLPAELDAAERENRELRRELASLKNRLPVLQLHFHPDLDLLSVKPFSSLISLDDFVKGEMIKIVEDHLPLQPFLSADQKPDSPTFNALYYSVTRLQAEQYNRELFDFYNSYKDHFTSMYEHITFRHHCLEIQFVLQNMGTSPATDIDILLHFPDGFEVVDEVSFPKILPEPSAPYRPQSRFDRPDLSFSTQTAALSAIETIADTSYNPDQPVIEKTNGWEVNYSFQGLKHHQTIQLIPLYLKYNDITKDTKSFGIDYKIIVGNLSNPVQGRLNIKFEKPQEPLGEEGDRTAVE